jgi:2,3-dihydroxybenzoate decarboxylase
MRPSKHDYRYYFTNNVSVTTSGNFTTAGLKFCIDEIGLERCLYSIDYPYESVKEAQDWWKTVDLPNKEKEAVARGNAIRLFKLPLEP